MIAFYERHKEIIRYLFWGVATTIVSWGTYSLSTLLLKQLRVRSTVLITVAGTISWICAVLFAFMTNKAYVFDSHSWKKEVVITEMVKFISSRITTGLIEIIGVPLLVVIGLDQTILGIEGMLSKMIVSIVVIILNYIFSKRFVFKDTKEQNEK